MSDQNTELFDQLYRDNHAKVFRLALSLAGNPHDAEDITQEAFFRAFRSYSSFRQDSSFFTWIYRITVNVANDHLRTRTKLPIDSLTEDLGYALEEVIDPNPASNPETELLAYQARIKCLHAMTECLPPDQRKVFCLAIPLELPHKTIAEILDCSVGSVKTTLHRAKKRWLGFMENRCRLIKRSNPCRCSQFVRFGLAQGWVSKTSPARPGPSTVMQAKSDVVDLRVLRDLYRDMLRDDAEQRFVERLRDGIRRREWSILT